MRNKKGFTLVEIMLVVAIIALLAAIAIPNLLRAKISANEALAQSTLKTLSTASETFATANNGSYPADEAALTDAVPSYTNKSYCTGAAISGYTYDCSGMSDTSYTITATASENAGTKNFSISTGGVLTEAAI